ncbi:MAG: TonB-dependent receptor [Candidatus Aminicenantes bacterium]|nr:TonB-dependent receptor [Candidatus Aminicenantes bacterium]MDH5715156.1 TonB-dependent receptor [Candidatus Aminicenantes bacterium]
MMRKASIACLALFLSFTVLTIAFSQVPTGEIKGVAKDATGAVLPGVTVSATSPALIGGARTSITGERGGYRLINLNTGIYEVKFELEGFKTVIRQNIKVSLNITTTINVEMQIAPMAETIIVTGESPVVDVKTANIGVTFDKELLEKVPNARDVWVLLEESPGMVMDRFNVGGSESGQQSGFSAGSGEMQSQYNFDGIDITDMAATGAATYFAYDSFEELQVSTHAHKAEVPSPGVYLNIVTKQGGNRFHGGGAFYYEKGGNWNYDTGEFEPSWMTTTNVTPELEAAGIAVGKPMDYWLNYSFELGGRIIQDKLWFYGIREVQKIHSFAPGYYEDVARTTPGIDATDLPHYMLKLTWQVTPRNKITFSQFHSEKFRPHRDSDNYAYITAETAYKQASPKNIPQIHWTTLLSDKAMFDISFGYMDMDFPLAPTDENTWSQCLYEYRILSPTDPQPYPHWARGYFGSYYAYYMYYRDRWQNNNTFSYYVDDFLGGSHDFKMGFNIMDFTSHTNRYSYNGTRWGWRNGKSYNIMIENDDLEIWYSVGSKGFYIQDTWTLKERMTINLGVRWDTWECYLPEQHNAAAHQLAFIQTYNPDLVQYFEDRTYRAQRDMVNFSKLAPRIGFIYDVFGDGKTALKFNWSRYGHQIGNWVANWSNPNGRVYMYYRWYDDGDGVFEWGEQASKPYSGPYMAAANQILPGLKQPFTDEFSIGVDHELMEDIGISATFVYKKDKDLIEDVAQGIPYDAYDKLTLADPGPDEEYGTGDDGTFTVYEMWPDYVGQPEYWVMRNIGKEEAERIWGREFTGIYKAFILRFTKRWSHNWHMLASYTYSSLNSFRYDASDQATALLDDPNADIYAWGPTFYSRPHLIKIAGSYQFPYGINLGGFVRYQSGAPWDRSIIAEDLNQGDVEVRVEPRGSQRLDGIFTVDLRLSKVFRLPKGNLEAMFDVFNLFNANTITSIGTTTLDDLERPLNILPPRIARFGVKYTF